ncbi:carboxypeptidase-like regulatory domain-containing protein [Autumnicola musiva]|uniref:Carboxypeptidase-like regulatory domain-containing protein n=1 Tax=Autumnicola musiva TaxID=3075589 RepID=A0ABU3D7X0_9FLAO|nr:carboxypeptidase-like regulatory domain-containing protein [Zunongwangia sp. F117]MDT0677604.1 carboxypeptidase-like regulatory domain-containing protein [Zunongwangia sp. F117]
MACSINSVGKEHTIRTYLFLIVIFIGFSAISQEVSLKGKVVDTSGALLGSATVYLEKIADSSLIGYTISKANGEFELSEKTTERKANLYISFAGFQTYQNVIELKEEVDLGNIILDIQENSLDEIFLTGKALLSE